MQTTNTEGCAIYLATAPTFPKTTPYSKGLLSAYPHLLSAYPHLHLPLHPRVCFSASATNQEPVKVSVPLLHQA